MPDISLTCRECGSAFLHTESEQDYFKAQGFSAPRRCRPCRAKNRRTTQPGGGKPSVAGAQTPSAAVGVSESPDGNVNGGAPVEPDSAIAAARAAKRAAMPKFPAVCSLCGTETEVPFVPDGKRPVFCLVCLKQRTR